MKYINFKYIVLSELFRKLTSQSNWVAMARMQRNQDLHILLVGLENSCTVLIKLNIIYLPCITATIFLKMLMEQFCIITKGRNNPHFSTGDQTSCVVPPISWNYYTEMKIKEQLVYETIWMNLACTLENSRSRNKKSSMLWGCIYSRKYFGKL